MKKRAIIASVLACFFIFGTFAEAEARRSTKLRLGFAIATSHHIGLGYQKFAELVEEKSNGKIKVEIFGNAVLGNDRTLGEAVQSGTLDLVSLPTPALPGFNKAFMVLDLPYVLDPEKRDKLNAALDKGPLKERLREEAVKIGLEPLMYSEYGYRSFQTVGKKINKIDDLKGLKIRTTDSPVEVAIASAAGMIPTPIAWSEVYTALAQGVVNAVSNSAAMSNEAKHAEILKYATDSRQTASFHHLFMNKKKWDSLTNEQRKIISEAALEANAWQRNKYIEQENATLKAWADSGIVIIELPDAEKEKLGVLMRKVRDEFSKDLPQDLLQLILEVQK